MEGRPLDEAELVERARRGDHCAYEELVRMHQSIAHRTAYLITGSAADADDAVQSGFVKAYYALARFRASAPFRPWLLAIVANEARNSRRGSARRAALALRAREDRPADDAAPSPEQAVLARADRQRVLDAVAALGERDRLAIACRYLLDLSEAESAAVMGCSRGTVKSRVSRALGRLRARLTPEGAP